jgi:hypothetical protein
MDRVSDVTPYDPGPVAMALLGALVLALIIVILLAAVHCAVLDPSDVQCRGGNWGQNIREVILELAPILIALIVVRR